jgi:hypothetical protein
VANHAVAVVAVHWSGNGKERSHQAAIHNDTRQRQRGNVGQTANTHAKNCKTHEMRTRKTSGKRRPQRPTSSEWVGGHPPPSPLCAAASNLEEHSSQQTCGQHQKIAARAWFRYTSGLFLEPLCADPSARSESVAFASGPGGASPQQHTSSQIACPSVTGKEHARPCEKQHVALFNVMARMTPSTRKTVHASIHHASPTHAGRSWLLTAVAGLVAAVTVPAAGSPVAGTLHRRPLPLNVDVGLVVPTDGGAAVDWVRAQRICDGKLAAGWAHSASHPSNIEFQSPPTSCTILAISHISPRHTLRPSLLAFRHSIQLPTVHLDFHHAHHAPHPTPSYGVVTGSLPTVALHLDR